MTVAVDYVDAALASLCAGVRPLMGFSVAAIAMRIETSRGVMALASLMLAIALPAVGGEPRVRFCDNCSPQPGKGYTMCERFLKALNSPKTDPVPVCEINLPKEFKDFQQPSWQPVPVMENMRLVYDMEMFLVGPNERDYYYTKWRKYFPDKHWREKRLEDPRTWRRIPYEEWLTDFQARIQKREIEPRLSSTVAELNEHGSKRLFRYERTPGGEIAECRRNVQAHQYGIGGAYLFAEGTNPETPVAAIISASTLQSHLLIYRGKAVFALSTGGPNYYVMHVQMASPNAPTEIQKRNGEEIYVLVDRCGFERR